MSNQTTPKVSTWQKHRKGEHVPNCWYCGNTNGLLTEEQEKYIIESVNKLVEEKKKEKK